MVSIVFLVAAVVAVVFAIVTIAHSSPVINVLSLVVVFFAMAAIFAILGMDFLAAIQIIVYSGAILVLFLFVIMLLNIRSVERLGSGRRVQALLGTVVAVGIGAAGAGGEGHGEGDNGEVGRVEHQLERQEDRDAVAPQQHAEGADREQGRGQRENPGMGDRDVGHRGSLRAR
jgi:hypothetical protein